MPKGLILIQNLREGGHLTIHSGIVWVQVSRVVEILGGGLGMLSKTLTCPNNCSSHFFLLIELDALEQLSRPMPDNNQLGGG